MPNRHLAGAVFLVAACRMLQENCEQTLYVQQGSKVAPDIGTCKVEVHSEAAATTHDADKRQADRGFQIQVVDRPVVLQQLALLLNITLTGFA